MTDSLIDLSGKVALITGDSLLIAAGFSLY